MITIHDQFTQQMCDRLTTTCLGLGLVRLLKDAKRFEEARTTLCLLEIGFREGSDKPNPTPSNPRRITRRTSRSTGSTLIGAA